MVKRKRWNLYITSFLTILLAVIGPTSLFVAKSISDRRKAVAIQTEYLMNNRLQTLMNGVGVDLWNFSPEDAAPFVKSLLDDQLVTSIKILDSKGQVF